LEKKIVKNFAENTCCLRNKNQYWSNDHRNNNIYTYIGKATNFYKLLYVKFFSDKYNRALYNFKLAHNQAINNIRIEFERKNLKNYIAVIIKICRLLFI